ncbi:MAG: tyrosine-type recombinase/integrase [Candidatus Acidiferrales bacterium]
MSGWSKARPLEAQTEIIPDEVLGPLVQASLEYIDRYADFLLDANETVAKLRQHNKERYRFQRLAARYLREHVLKASNFGDGLCARQLNKELCYLQTACFVVIAFATGMRVSELLSLSEGCCEIQTEPGQADLAWLRSRVFKMQGMPQGRSAKWLGGPLCARAVRVLERLGRRTRRQTKSRSLWVPVPPLMNKPREAGPFTASTIQYRLEVFVAMLGLKDSNGRPFHLHPHMFRRTFARHVVRYGTTNLLAVSAGIKRPQIRRFGS